MTPLLTVLLFVVAAAVGAVGRHLVARLACTWQALLVVNTVGSAVLGWLVSRDVSDAMLTVLGIGLCGSFTTFGSFALEVRSLGFRLGLAYVAATLVSVTGAASIASTF